MKKLLFFSILMMAVLSVNYSLKEPRVNTLLLDNIEALAADEQDVPTNCWGSGSVDCPVTKVKVNAERKSKVDDNTAKMQSIKWLGV